MPETNQPPVCVAHLWWDRNRPCETCVEIDRRRKEMISMSTKETSEEIASIAAHVLKLSPFTPKHRVTYSDYNTLLKAAKRLAGSALSQREEDVKPDAPIMVPVEIDWELITNAIVGSVEQASGDWMGSFLLIRDDERSQHLRRQIKLKDGVWYAEADYWTGGGKASVTFDNPSEGEELLNKEIAASDLLLGLRRMAEKSPKHFADLMNENDDAITHDVFMQYVLLGEIVYG